MLPMRRVSGPPQTTLSVAFTRIWCKVVENAAGCRCIVASAGTAERMHLGVHSLFLRSQQPLFPPLIHTRIFDALLLLARSKVTVVYPKRNEKHALFVNLVEQVTDVGIEVLYTVHAQACHPPTRTARAYARLRPEHSRDHFQPSRRCCCVLP